MVFVVANAAAHSANPGMSVWLGIVLIVGALVGVLVIIAGVLYAVGRLGARAPGRRRAPPD